MESVKQERHDLLNDIPVAKSASGDRSFMSKHCCDMSKLSPIKHCGPGHK